MRLLFIIIVLAMIHSGLSGRILFVDPAISSKCNEYDPGLRACSGGKFLCFPSIQQAVDWALYGDTVLIREGFYADTLRIRVESDGPGYLTLMSYGEEKAVIDGNNPDLGPLVVIESDRIRLAGLAIRHSRTFGIFSRNTRDIEIDRCEVSYSNDGGIVFVDAADITVSRCHVHHNNYRGTSAAHEAISMHNVHTFRVHHCQVHDNKEEGIDAKYGSKYGKIYNNLVYRNNGPNIYIDKTNLIDVYNNVIHSAVMKAGISLNIESRWHTEGLPWTLQHVNIYNNIIYNNSGGIGFWLEPGDGKEKQARWDHVYIVNNTIVENSRPGDDRGGGIYILNPEPENFGDSIIIRNNLFYGNDRNGLSKNIWDRHGRGQADKFIIDHNLFMEGEQTDYTGENTILAKDPVFRDPENQVYFPDPGSDAIDAGVAAGAPSTDLRGNPRPAGKAVDIGAYEYTP